MSRPHSHATPGAVPTADEATEEKYHLALSWISSLPSDGNVKLSTSQQLYFYGLYKQIKEGDCRVDKPSMFNPVARAKWTAWNQMSGRKRDECMSEYVTAILALAKSISPSDLGPEYQAKRQDFIDALEAVDARVQAAAAALAAERAQAAAAAAAAAEQGRAHSQAGAVMNGTTPHIASAAAAHSPRRTASPRSPAESHRPVTLSGVTQTDTRAQNHTATRAGQAVEDEDEEEEREDEGARPAAGPLTDKTPKRPVPAKQPPKRYAYVPHSTSGTLANGNGISRSSSEESSLHAAPPSIPRHTAAPSTTTAATTESRAAPASPRSMPASGLPPQTPGRTASTLSALQAIQEDNSRKLDALERHVAEIVRRTVDLTAPPPSLEQIQPFRDELGTILTSLEDRITRKEAEYKEAERKWAEQLQDLQQLQQQVLAQLNQQTHANTSGSANVGDGVRASQQQQPQDHQQQHQQRDSSRGRKASWLTSVVEGVKVAVPIGVAVYVLYSYSRRKRLLQ